MSDTTDTQETETSTTLRVVTISEWVEAVGLSPEIIANLDGAEPRLSTTEAWSALLKANGIDDNSAGAQFLRHYLSGLGDEYLRQSIMESIDVRPILDYVNQLDGAVMRVEFDDGEVRWLQANGSMADEDYARQHPIAVGGLTSDIDKITNHYVQETLKFSEGTLDDAQTQELKRALARYTTSEVSLRPEVDPATLAAATGTGDIAAIGGVDATGPTKDDLWALFNTNFWDGKGNTAREAVQAMIQMEAEQGSAGNMLVDQPRTTPWDTTSPYRDPKLTKPTSTTWNGALNYLYEQTPQGVRTLQQNMRDAGVYDIIGKQVGDWGDRSDQATLDAWAYVMAESYRRQVTPMQMLNEQAKTYWTEKDPASFNTGSSINMVDSWARELIGRNLSEQEKAMLAGYMLRMDKAGKTPEAAYGERAQTGTASPTDVQNFVHDQLGNVEAEQQTASNPVLDYLRGMT